jgi:hypothetical protein
MKLRFPSFVDGQKELQFFYRSPISNKKDNCAGEADFLAAQQSIAIT